MYHAYSQLFVHEYHNDSYIPECYHERRQLCGRRCHNALFRTIPRDCIRLYIQSIDYSWGEINFEYHPMNKELLMEDCMCEPCEAGGSYDVNMEPDDIEVSDTVTVIWELG